MNAPSPEGEGFGEPTGSGAIQAEARSRSPAEAGSSRGLRRPTLLGRLTLHTEVDVLVVGLALDVGLDGLIGYVAAAAAEVAAGPQVAPPERPPQVGKLGEQVVRGPPLQPLDQAASRDLRRARHEEVDVVSGHVPFENLHLLLPADLPDEFADPQADFARQDRLAVFGHPHKVEVDHEHGVGPLAVVHATILPQALLKLSPEGEGFNPPKWGQ